LVEEIGEGPREFTVGVLKQKTYHCVPLTEVKRMPTKIFDFEAKYHRENLLKTPLRQKGG